MARDYRYLLLQTHRIFLPLAFYPVIQFVQNNVRKQRGDDSTLRSAFFGEYQFPVGHLNGSLQNLLDDINTNSDPAAVRDATKVGQQLEKLGKTDVRLVVNRVSKKLYETMSLTVDDVMDRSGLPLLGIVPEDANVTLAAAFEQPLLAYTQKGAAAACRRIAKRIQGLPEPISVRKI